MKKLLTILMLFVAISTTAQDVRLYLYSNTINVLQYKKNCDLTKIQITEKSYLEIFENKLKVYSTSKIELESFIKNTFFHRIYFNGSIYSAYIYPQQGYIDGYITYFFKGKYTFYLFDGVGFLPDFIELKSPFL